MEGTGKSGSTGSIACSVGPDFQPPVANSRTRAELKVKSLPCPHSRTRLLPPTADYPRQEDGPRGTGCLFLFLLVLYNHYALCASSSGMRLSQRPSDDPKMVLPISLHRITPGKSEWFNVTKGPMTRHEVFSDVVRKT